MTLRISKRGLNFIKGWESFVPHVYDDKLAPIKSKYREWDGRKPKGVLTIGYGHTNAAKHPLKIEKGLRITEAQARDILDVDLDECEEAVNRMVKVGLTQGQFDALTSLTFNMGTTNLRKSSLLRKLNAGDYSGARQAFDLYVNSGGEFMQGLQNRRDGEQALWDARYGVIPAEPVSHPAQVDAPAPPPKTGMSEGAVAGGGLTLAAILGKAWDAINNASDSVMTAILDLSKSPGFWIGLATWSGESTRIERVHTVTKCRSRAKHFRVRFAHLPIKKPPPSFGRSYHPRLKSGRFRRTPSPCADYSK